MTNGDISLPLTFSHGTYLEMVMEMTFAHLD